jgi:hypothetical protein
MVLTSDQGLLATSSHGGRWKGKKEAPDPPLRGNLSWPNHLLKALFLIVVQWKLNFSLNLGGNKLSNHSQVHRLENQENR